MAIITEQKQAYQEKVKSEVDLLNAQINEFKAKEEQIKAELSVEYYNQLEEIYAKRDAVQSKLKELQEAGEEAFDDIQTGFEKAWNELNTSFQNALSKFE